MKSLNNYFSFFKVRQSWLFLETLLLIFIVCACKDHNDSPPLLSYGSAESIQVDPTTISLMKDETYTLKVTHYPEHHEKPSLSWESSDPEVATVNNSGMVTAQDGGTATITAFNNLLGLSSTCKVTVSSIKVTQISIITEDPTLYEGETLQVETSVLPIEASYTLLWSSSDEEVATVEDGLVYGHKVGETTIKAEVKGTDLYAAITIMVRRDSKMQEINMSEPGTLEEKLGKSLFEVTDLIITGNIDIRDLNTLSRMTQLYYLDMGEVVIQELRTGSSVFPGNQLNDKNFIDSDLHTIIFPKHLEVIPRECFYGSRKLVKAVLPPNLLRIEDYAFGYCIELAEIELPASLTSIGISAFAGKSNMERLTIPENVTYIGNSAFMTTFMNEIILPSTLQEINHKMFEKSPNLKNIVIPETVTTIGHSVFKECDSLEQINIPKGVKKLGDMTFYFCKSLKKIDLYCEEPPVVSHETCFQGVDKETCILYVPHGTSLAYKVSNRWKDFKHIIERN